MDEKTLLAKIYNMDENSKSALESYIDFLAYPDHEDEDVLRKKIECYSLYSNKIAGLISEIEVYKHDLPREIEGLLEMMFRMMSVLATTETRELKLRLCDKVLLVENFLQDVTNIILLRLLLEEIRKYKKRLKCFNYQGVLVEDGDSFMGTVNKKLKEIKKSYKLQLKKFKRKFELNSIDMILILDEYQFVQKWIRKIYSVDLEVCQANNDSLNLENTVHDARELKVLCEFYYPDIVSNGYNGSFGTIVVRKIPLVINAVLAVIGAYLIVQKFL